MRPPPERTGNMLLDSLPDDDLSRLLDGRGPIALTVPDEVLAPDAPIDRILFPTAGVVSVVTFIGHSNGNVKSVEAISIGREGMTNAHVTLGARRSGGERSFVQVAGKALAVPAARVVEEAERKGTFARVVNGYIQAYWAHAAYGSACNAVHHVTPRCARWLLQTHDRVDGDTFVLTQEYLANMLGVERSTVSVAAGELQRQGLIRYSRGKVEILDREGLEAAACECYELIRSEYARFVPLD